MSDRIPLREAALAALLARLEEILPDVPAERARRSEVDTDAEDLPRLVLIGGDMPADDTAEPGCTHYQIEFTVTGYAAGDDDVAAERALGELHARVLEALAGWMPEAPGLGDVAERGADFGLFPAEDSARAAGSFTARFSLLAVAPTGSPYSS